MKGKKLLVLATTLMLTASPFSWITHAEAATPSTTTSTRVMAQTLFTVSQNVSVTMRDGTVLKADVYLPKTGGLRFPTLVSRTPYGKGNGSDPQAIYLAEHGYAVVVQDVRGRGESQGVYYPFLEDGKDGYDTIEWAAKQDWSDGKVGTYGASALAIVQNAAALENPPHLKAMFSEYSTADIYSESYYQGGALRQSLVQGWLNGMNVEQLQRLDPTNIQALKTTAGIAQNLQGYFNLEQLPLNAFPNLTSTYMPAYQDTLNTDVATMKDPIYREIDDTNNIMDKLNQIHVPVFHIGGFYDIFETGVLNGFSGLQNKGGKGAKGNQMLVMGPWTHVQNMSVEPWAGQNSTFNDTATMVQWFDYWLKGIHNQIMEQPAVKYYVTGINHWETSSSWPLKTTKTEPFYFHPKTSGTIDSVNDGSLSLKRDSHNEGSNTYLYNPLKPTGTIGGNNLMIANGALDQRPDEVASTDPKASQVLTFTSDPLKNPLEVVGPATAKLFVSSTAVDTDFTVKITDVAPDGTSTLIEDSITRAKYRDGQQKAKLLKPGKIYQVNVNIAGISHEFLKGHRIRIDLASSNYPRFDRNLNTGHKEGVDTASDAIVAQNTIYHDAAHPSAINLPIVQSNNTHKEKQDHHPKQKDHK